MKWIGQHIWDFISRFRSDVYMENLAEVEHEFSVMVGPDGKLTKSTHPGERSRIQIRNDEGATIPAGAPIYSKGEVGGSETIKVGICDSSDPAKMPCIGIVETELNTTDNKDGFATTQGVYNTNISGFTGLSEGDILYVNGGSAPHLTQTKPTSGDLIQNVGVVIKTNGTICQGLLVAAIGRTNDVPWPLYVDHTNQRVGIETSSPEEKLSVNGNIQLGNQKHLTWSDIGDGNTLRVSIKGDEDNDLIAFRTDNSERMRLTNTGLGIGTTSPSNKLHVVSSDNVGTTKIISAYSLSGTQHTFLGYNSLVGSHSLDITTLSTQPIAFNTNNSEKMRLTSDGELGIGTTSPDAILHIKDVNPRIIKLQDANYTNQYATIGFDDGHIRLSSDPDNQRANSIIAFSIDNSLKMLLTSDGKLGLGTSSPTTKMEIAGTGNQKFLVNRTDGDSFFIDAQNGQIRLRGTDNIIMGVGADVLTTTNTSVGIGTTSPSEQLHVVGNALITGNLTVSGTTTTINTVNLDVKDNNITLNYSTGDSSSTADGAGITIQDAVNSTTNATILWDATNDKFDFSHGATFTNNVGIGTSSPAYALDVASSGATTLRLTSSGTSAIAMRYENTGGHRGGVVVDNNGLYRIDATNIQLNPTNNVGIGTSSPTDKLDVYGNIKLVQTQNYIKFANDFVTIKRDGNNFLSLNGYAGFKFNETNGAGELMRLTSTGLGIGTSSPARELEITGTGNVYARITAPTSSDSAALELKNVNELWTLKADDTASDSFKITNDGGTKLTLTTGGNLGIGTTNPTTNLQLGSFGTANQEFRIESDGNSYFSILTTNGVQKIYAGGAGTQSNEMAFYTSSSGAESERMRLTSAGRLAIGGTNPLATLHVFGSAVISSYIYMGTGQRISWGNGNQEISATDDAQIDFKTGGSEKMRLTSAGRLGIGLTNVLSQLHVFESSTEVDRNAGITVEQGSTGDSLVQYLLTGVRRWVTGIDNSDNDSFKISSSEDLNSDNVLTLTTGGNVGIGTSSPSQKLTVEGNIELGTGGYIYGDTTTPYLRLSNAAGSILGYSNGYISVGPSFVYYNASGEQFRINHSNGHVGIGTSSPQELLHLFKQSHSNPLLIEVENDGYLAGTSAGIKLTSKATDGVSGSWTIDNLNRDTLRFLDDGSEKMRLTSGGNLLLGTTTDSARLTVDETTTNNLTVAHLKHNQGGVISNLLLENSAGANDTGFSFDFKLASSGTSAKIGAIRTNSPGAGDTDMFFSTSTNGTTVAEAMRLTSDGRLGIGTSSPSNKLQIETLNNNDGFRLNYPSTNSTQYPFFIGKSDDSNYVRVNANIIALKRNGATSTIKTEGSSNDLTLQSQRHLIFNTSDANERVRITSDGNVGIGTTSPASTLNISGGTGSLSTGLTFGDGDTGIWEAPDDNLRFSTGSSTRMLISSSGNILIGTTTDDGSNKLQVAGNISLANNNTSLLGKTTGGSNLAILKLDSSNNFQYGSIYAGANSIMYTATDFLWYTYPSSVLSQKMTLKQNGNLLLNTTTDDGSSKLQVAGNIKIGDNNNFIAGTGGDFQIQHTGSHSYVDNFTGDLFIRQNATDEDMFFMADDGTGNAATYFFLDGSATRTKFAKPTQHSDDIYAYFGNSDDLRIFHSTGGNIANHTNDLRIQNWADGKDIRFECDNGTGGLTDYIIIDGSQTTINLQKTVLIGTTTNTGAYKIDVAGKQRVQDTLELDDVLMLNQISTPADPAAGKSVIYMDSADGGIKCKINVGGTVVTRTLASFE